MEIEPKKPFTIKTSTIKTVFRYPGGKSKVASLIANLFPAGLNKYAEPFLGGGSVLIEVAKRFPNAELLGVEKSASVVAVWDAILNKPRDLIREVQNHPCPTVSDYVDRRRRLVNGGFSALDQLVVNRCSFSGRGRGPIGGMNQSGKWKIDARWNVNALADTILALHRLLHGRTKIIWGSAFDVDLHEYHLYCDPPYVVAGEQLYDHSFTMADHERLAHMLANRDRWVLSYDWSEYITKLYENSGAERHVLQITRAASDGGGSRQDELLYIKPTL